MRLCSYIAKPELQTELANLSGDAPCYPAALAKVAADARKWLLSLPGVGQKTASIVLCFAFGKPAIPVDTHVFRVANRTGLAPGRTPAEVEHKLLKVTPPEYLLHAHHWLILHGRHVCVARRPKCYACVISACCAFRPKTPAPA